MDQQILRLTPKRYLCPYCGKWHMWNGRNKLGYYDSERYKARFECDNAPSNCNEGDYRIYFDDGYCYYSTDAMCSRATQSINGRIPISSIIESTDKPIVTFEVPFTAKSDVGSYKCANCYYKDECILVKLGDEGDHRHMSITFGFEFDQADYNRYVKPSALARKEKELQEREAAVGSKERALKEREDTVGSKEQALKGREQAIDRKEQALKGREQAIDRKEQDLKEREDTVTNKEKENMEDTTMANIFNMNMEFGPNKDENIASTLMGVAVKNGDSWRIYDKKNKEITDVGDMQLGKLPIFILPATQLSEGDLIKDAGEYYFVIKVQSGSTQTLCAKTGELKNVVPIKNVLGFSCYSKVIALSDSLNMGDDFDVEKLAIMSAMCGQTGGENGGQLNQLLLPLMLLKDKLGGDDDKMKLVLMSSMMTSEDDGGKLNQLLLPLMLLKDKLGGDDDKMKLVLMSSMMGGNMAGSNNPLMSYLMLDAFVGKKDGKAPQTGDGAAE